MSKQANINNSVIIEEDFTTLLLDEKVGKYNVFEIISFLP